MALVSESGLARLFGQLRPALLVPWFIAILVLVCTSCNSDHPSNKVTPGDSAGVSGSIGPDASLEILVFNGICDGSAAVRIGDDQLLIAYDERNSLYLFNRNGGPVKQELPYRKLLQLQDSAETDLEGAAISGDSIWWVGSHGLDGDAEGAPNRRVLFQTDLASVSSGQLTINRKPIDLLPLLLGYEPLKRILTNEVMATLPKKGGLNIEGLAVDADGSLMVGLRSPLLSGEAIVVRFDVLSDSILPVALYRIDLGERGIRDIISVADGYMLIAGATGGDGRFALYRWSPDSAARKVVEIPAGINAEALLAMDDHWLVLSDDGKVTRADDDAKDGDRRCDRIFKKNPLHGKHQNVFFRAVKIPR